MIPITVVVCVLGGWCAIYLVDTLLKVRAADPRPDGSLWSRARRGKSATSPLSGARKRHR